MHLRKRKTGPQFERIKVSKRHDLFRFAHKKTAPVGEENSNLEAEKHSAEIQKIKAETERIKKEIGVKLDAEVSKTIVETEKLRKESGLGHRLQSIFQGTTTIIAVAGLVWTVISGIEKTKQESEGMHQRAIADALKDLADNDDRKRRAAAIRLARLARSDNAPELNLARKTLLFSLLQESDLVSIASVLDALTFLGCCEVSDINFVLINLRKQIVDRFHVDYPGLGTYEELEKKLAKPTTSLGASPSIDQGAETQRLRREMAKKVIVAHQHSVLRLAELIMSNCREKEMVCRLSLDKSMLRNFSFVDYPLRFQGATFIEANLTWADFYRVDLSAANFQAARLHGTAFDNASLRGATFVHAKIELVASSRRTSFHGADIQGAIFDYACLSGADFSKSLNLDPESFRKAYIYKAIFSDAQRADLLSHKIDLNAQGGECSEYE